MQLLTSEKANSQFEVLLHQGVVATIGNFDGVHMGHQHLIALTMKKAQALACKSLVITFEPRPIEVLAPEKSSTRLFSRQDQFEMLDKLGVDFLYVQKFDQDFAKQSFEDFIQTTLIGRLNIKGLILGHDFAMGRERRGTSQAIVDFLAKLHIPAERSEAVLFAGAPISTSRIKKNLEAGEVEASMQMLGRPFYLQGAVVSGAKLGRTIGVPTANLQVVSIPQLKLGVYATRTLVDGRLYASITNVGVNPTVNSEGQQVKVETNIFDFSSDIYNKTIRVQFIKFIRDEMKFADLEKLKEQIYLDIKVAKEILR